MAVLETNLDPLSSSAQDNRGAMLRRLTELEEALDSARSGGGQKYVTRHHARGKLLARERIELLVDREAPFLELSPVAGWGSNYPVGAGLVTGVGVVSGALCMIIANDPTIRGGAINPYSLKKTLRATEIARSNRLPLINLVESGGADLPAQAEIFIPGGAVFRDLTQLSAAGVPTIAVVFGNATAGGAYIPGLSDYTIFVRDQARVFLAGPPMVRLATGEITDDESLGGALMHAAQSGLADWVAEDDRDAIRLARTTVARLNGPFSSAGRHAAGGFAEPPKYSAEELLAIAPAQAGVAFDPREVLARILDGSEFDEFKPAYGPTLCTGWGAIHSYPIGIVANALGVLSSAEAQKAAQFIQLADASGTPLLFLQNTTGFAVGTEYEQGGIIKHGALMINAIANSSVPHLTVTIGASYGAGNYAMCGRAHDPRFLFAWPNAKAAVMGPAQLAGVLSIVARQAAGARGQVYDEERDASMRTMVENKIEQESGALHLSGMLYDDGVIDPRDTRTVLGVCLAAVQGGEPAGARTGGAAGAARSGYGVFRV